MFQAVRLIKQVIAWSFVWKQRLNSKAGIRRPKTNCLLALGRASLLFPALSAGCGVSDVGCGALVWEANQAYRAASFARVRVTSFIPLHA